MVHNSKLIVKSKTKILNQIELNISILGFAVAKMDATTIAVIKIIASLIEDKNLIIATIPSWNTVIFAI